MTNQSILAPEMKRVALMDVHNITGDLTTHFEGILIGELPVNPSNEGIVFFRWREPKPQKNETKAQAESRYFQALHQTVGLDALVVFCRNGYRPESDGLFLAEAIKKIDPAIKTIMQVYQRAEEDTLSTFIDVYAPALEAHDTLKTTLGLDPAYIRTINTFDIQRLFIDAHPLLRKPEQLALTVPATPFDTNPQKQRVDFPIK